MVFYLYEPPKASDALGNPDAIYLVQLYLSQGEQPFPYVQVHIK
jgi:hypothetical protein